MVVRVCEYTEAKGPIARSQVFVPSNHCAPMACCKAVRASECHCRFAKCSVATPAHDAVLAKSPVDIPTDDGPANGVDLVLKTTRYCRVRANFACKVAFASPNGAVTVSVSKDV